MNFRSGVIAWMLAASCLLAGCASNRREVYLQDKAGAHVYRQPIAEVWSQAKALDRDYALEWKLLQRVDAEAAKALEAEAAQNVR
ncbi:hypothetical protein [Stigmatella hybrida]|uniref:hypothetical protein n=1 Tax=Stigmatella hybrida TaxID=394097 RepID=UPI001CDAC3AB|nr:hypothetical protein [Stigmatella hybrida]